MIHDDEALIRRLDGELSPNAARAVDRAAAADPALAARLARLQGQRGLARDAFPIASDPRDHALARMIAAGGQTRGSDGWMDRVRAAIAPRHAPLWGGLALAAFVGGLSIGWIGRPAPTGFSVGADATIADAGLVRVLNQGLASEDTSLGLTFRDQNGDWCRTFQRADQGLAGLACREDDRWKMQVLAPIDAPTGDLRTAAAETPLAVLTAVDAIIAGDTLDADTERRARDAGWGR